MLNTETRKLGRPPLEMTPERVAMLKAKADAKKRQWSLLAREKRRLRLAAKAIAEGREPGVGGGVKRFTTEELKQHERDRNNAYNALNRDKRNEASKASMARLYKEDPKRFSDRSMAREAKLKVENPEVFRLSSVARRATHRAKTMGIAKPGDSVTQAVLNVSQRTSGCAACSSPDRLELDHIVALVKGGQNVEGNFQFLCKPCNTSKGDRDYDTWLKGRAPLSELAA